MIAVFSRADENYSVGTVEKGSTRILAEMIAEETGGRLFNIERAVPYPAAYDACTEEAKKEQDENARPALREDIDISNYDVIFLGYPNWWGDMPMPVYTFLEAHDFAGKIVVPFCTHAGSGLSGTETSIAGITGAAVRKGLAVPGTTAHNSQAEGKECGSGSAGSICQNEQKMAAGSALILQEIKKPALRALVRGAGFSGFIRN